MQASKRNWSGAFVGFFLLLAGLTGAYFTAGHMVFGYVASQNWVTVPAELRRIEFVNSKYKFNENTTYKLEGAYTYRFDGAEYRSNKISLVFGRDNIGSYWSDLYKKIVSLYKKDQLLAYVNPDNPAEAVLDRTLRLSHLLFGAISLLVFSGFGMVFMLSSLGFGNQRKDARDRFGGNKGNGNPIVKNNVHHIDISGGVKRNIVSGLIGTAAGFFILAIGYLSIKDGWGPGYIFLAIGIFIIGYTLLIFIKKMALKIEVKIDKQARVLHLRKMWFGVFPLYDRADIIEPKQFFVEQISSGAENKYYALKFNTNNRIITISGCIQGRRAAYSLLKAVIRYSFETEDKQAA